MSIVCAISGTTPDEPVLSPSTGYVYEKRLLLKALSTNDSKCPITDKHINSDDLIDVKVNKSVKPRPPSCQSVPGLLGALQNEWDAMMLESFELRKYVESIRQQLSHTLYQHDAACRVIARVMKERDEARSALDELRATISQKGGLHIASAAAAAAAVETSAASDHPNGLNAEMQTKLKEMETTLRTARKGRVVPDDLIKSTEISNLKSVETHNLHSSSTPGVTCVAKMGDLIVSGGVDGILVLFDTKTQHIICKGSSHSAAITSVHFVHEGPLKGDIISTSDDKTIKVWSVSVDQEDGSKVLLAKKTLRGHTAGVSGFALHPCGEVGVSCSLDKSVIVWDLNQGKVASCVRDLTDACTSIALQPDGMTFVVGLGNGSILAYNTLSCDLLLNFGDCHDGRSVSSLSFSENGYHMLSAGGDCVKLWDLRKGSCLGTHTSKHAANGHSSRSKFERVTAAFDKSGSYALVLSYTVVEVLAVSKKGMESVAVLENEHGSWVTAAIDADGLLKKIVTASMDKTVKEWEL
eukprot:GDKK01072699.1.p1 GENE.GDKK01072699.1~~GDKK01072699.1.p1  ORF type:complete len:524 (-),score=127.14 GDKK01072699.1:109-1680(-)